MHMSAPIHTALLPPLPHLHLTHNTSCKIYWYCVLCRHEITSQKFSKGRASAQTSEGSSVEPKLIHYMCCICLLLKSPEHSGCLSRSLSHTLWLQTTSRILPFTSPLSLSKTPSFCLFPLNFQLPLMTCLTSSQVSQVSCSIRRYSTRT